MNDLDKRIGVVLQQNDIARCRDIVENIFGDDDYEWQTNSLTEMGVFYSKDIDSIYHTKMPFREKILEQLRRVEGV